MSLAAAIAQFFAENRLYDIETPLGPNALLVEHFVGKEGLSALYEYHVSCLSTDTHIELKSLLGRQAMLRTRLADGTQPVCSGYVSAVAQLGADGGLARYRLTLVPWLSLAAHQRRSRVFQEKSVLSIVEDVLAAYAPHNNWRVTPEADAFLAQARPRSYCCQYRESDYAFLSRLLAEEGIGFYFDEAKADDRAVARQALVLFADSTAFPDDASTACNGGIRFHHSGGVELQDSIRTFNSERRLQSATTTISSWDYKAKRVIAASTPTVHAPGGENAPRIENNDWAGVYAFATLDEAERAAAILREAADAHSMNWQGQGDVRSFRTGTAFNLIGSPLGWASSSDAQQSRFTLTGVLHGGINNLPTSLKQEVLSRLGPTQEYGLPKASPSYWPGPASDGCAAAGHSDTSKWDRLLETAQATGYANRFTAQRADVRWRPALFDGTGARLNPRPTAWGSQTAIVVGPEGTTANAGTVHTDHLGRVRIRHHWQQDENNSCWVRVAQMYAGPGYGAQFIPRIGQEVLVKFLDNDIDRPIIAGVLYNGRGRNDSQAYASAGDHTPAAQDNKSGRGASPAWHGGAGEHRHAGYLCGLKSVALGADGYTRQSNQLIFDDTAGQLRTRLTTDAAATQLNLGHQIHQADNYRGSFRGSGWELRTDAHGAVRAGKGLLITTYYGSTPQGEPEPAGENSPGIALLKQAHGFADSFNRAATVHQTVQFILVKGGARNGEKRQSRLDEGAAPIAAMLHALSGRVSAHDGSHHVSGGTIPHSAAPLVKVVAQAGIGVAASDGLHVGAGEVAHLASGHDMQFAAGEALTVHSGQAIGILAGATSAGDDNCAIKLYAGDGDVELQAQRDEITFAATELIRLASARRHINLAAAKRITLETAGGASLTLEGGNIIFSCTGTISIKSSSKSFTGPDRVHHPLPKFPQSICTRCKRNAAGSGSPFSMVEG